MGVCGLYVVKKKNHLCFKDLQSNLFIIFIYSWDADLQDIGEYNLRLYINISVKHTL